MNKYTKNIRLPLAGVNFFLADVAGGLGPFLAIYLLTVHNWSPGNIGLVLTISGITTIVTQTPAGIIVDSIKLKKELLMLMTVAVIFSVFVVSFNASFLVITIYQLVLGFAAAFFGPLITGITLGLVGSKLFPKQFAENQSYNHAGNVFAAGLIGILVYYVSIDMVFYAVIFLGFFSVIFISTLKKDLIDHDRARNLDTSALHPLLSIKQVFIENKLLVMFSIVVLLFHLANAAVLTLVGEKLSVNGASRSSILLMSGSIISAQFVMFFMALLVQSKSNKWGRKPIFLIAFIALPIRCILCTFSNNEYYLLSVQLLDGVGAGIFGALFPIVVEDLTVGSGRYNSILGIIVTMQGIGAALSNLVAGYIVDASSFNTAFYSLAVIATFAPGLFFFFIKETMPKSN